MRRNHIRIAGIALAMLCMVGMTSACGADSAQAQENTTMAVEDQETKAGETKLPEEDMGGQEDETPDETTEETEETQKGPAADVLSDPTLGGIWETYTVEEYEEMLENVKKHADTDDLGNMEAILEKLKADNGKGEYVVYKSAFEESYEENGYFVSSAFNPMIVMNPWEEYELAGIELTAENYKQEIEVTTKTLDEAISKGMLTEEEKEIILAKMDDNLKKLK